MIKLLRARRVASNGRRVQFSGEFFFSFPRAVCARITRCIRSLSVGRERIARRFYERNDTPDDDVRPPKGIAAVAYICNCKRARRSRCCTTHSRRSTSPRGDDGRLNSSGKPSDSALGSEKNPRLVTCRFVVNHTRGDAFIVSERVDWHTNDSLYRMDRKPLYKLLDEQKDINDISA